MMRRSLSLFIVSTVLFIMLVVSTASASLDWELTWDYEGTITETLSSDNGFDETIPGEGWERISDRQFTRSLSNWEEYLSLNNRLPIDQTGRDLKFMNFLCLEGMPIAANNELAKAYADERVDIRMSLPGFIRESSGKVEELENGHVLNWQYSGMQQLSDENIIVRFWVVDGFLSAVLILVVVMFSMTIYVIMRMRKVSKFIRTEYSIENIDMAELEAEVMLKLNEIEKEKKENYMLKDIHFDEWEVEGKQDLGGMGDKS